MRRCTAVLLMLAFLALGTGAFEYLHNHEHLRDVGRHDDATCFIHGQLHSPVLLVVATLLVIGPATVVALLSRTTPSLAPQSATFRIACRGPPNCG